MNDWGFPPLLSKGYAPDDPVLSYRPLSYRTGGDRAEQPRTLQAPGIN
jgi:hypothetical protein